MKSIQETHQLLLTKKISAKEVAESFLKKAKENPTNSFITVTEESALTNAKLVDEKISCGKKVTILEGIPVGFKDLYLTKGIKSTNACKFLENYIPFTESTVTEKLSAQGTSLIGKLNLDEFAMGSTNEFSHFGACKNPWNKEHVSGGSSGGSAASIAEGSSLLTLGSDTGGSIRLPASYCGVVGIKPSYGRCSRYGMYAFASSLDQAGTLARNVFDAALGLEHIMGFDEKDSTSLSHPVPSLTKNLVADKNYFKGKKIGIPLQLKNITMTTDISKAMEKVFSELKNLGCVFVDVSLPIHEASIACYYLINAAEASSNLSRFDGIRFGQRATDYKNIHELYAKSRSEGFGEEVKRRIILGTFALSAGFYDAFYIKACKVRRLIRNDFFNVLKEVDIILSPVSSFTAPKLNEQMKDPYLMYLNDLFTIPVSLAGLPSMSIPIDLSSYQMPIGLQIIAPSLQEENLVNFAFQLENHLDTSNFLDRMKS